MRRLHYSFVSLKHWQLAVILVVLFFLQRPWFILTYDVVLVLLSTVFLTWVFSIARISDSDWEGSKFRTISYACWAFPIGYSIYVARFGVFPPAHILAVVAIFLNMVLAAKGLAAFVARKGGRLNFWVAFFSLWFFPIGLWYIQPKANGLVK